MWEYSFWSRIEGWPTDALVINNPTFTHLYSLSYMIGSVIFSIHVFHFSHELDSLWKRLIRSRSSQRLVHASNCINYEMDHLLLTCSQYVKKRQLSQKRGKMYSTTWNDDWLEVKKWCYFEKEMINSSQWLILITKHKIHRISSSTPSCY